MGRILVVIGNFHPRPSSVVVAASPLFAALRAAGHELEFVTNRTDPSWPRQDVVDGWPVTRIDDVRVLNVHRVASELSAARTVPSRGIAQVRGTLSKALNYARYAVVTQEPGTGGWDRRATLEAMLRLHRGNPFDAVLSVSQPYVTHYLAEQFLDRSGADIPWFMHHFDPFSMNRAATPNPAKRRYLLRDELRMLDRCTRAFVTPELKAYLDGTPIRRYADKLVPLAYASMTEHRYAGPHPPVSSGPATCFFAGTLYQGIRSPDYAIDVFARAGTDIELHLMTNYVVPQSIRASAGNLRISSFRPREQMLEVLERADILVNIGNTVEYQIPAKLFEYFGTGKPVIHVSKFAGDPCLSYVTRYPAALVVDELRGDRLGDASAIREFCARYRGTRSSFAEVRAALPECDSVAVCERYVRVICDALTG